LGGKTEKLPSMFADRFGAFFVRSIFNISLARTIESARDGQREFETQMERPQCQNRDLSFNREEMKLESGLRRSQGKVKQKQKNRNNIT